MLHAIKTGIAAALATAVYLAFQLPYGYWAVVSAVVVMQANVGGSIRASWSRMVGTAIGALLGAASASAAMAIAPHWLAKGGVGGVLFTAAAAGITVAATGAVCVLLRLDEALRLAGVTCSIVLLAFSRAPWTSAAHRTLDVAIGIAIAVFVALVVAPSRARLRLRERLADVVRDAGLLCERLAASYLVRDYGKAEVDALRDAMKKSFRDCRALVHEMELEPGNAATDVVSVLEVFRGVERVLEHVLALDEAARSSDRLPGEARHEPRLDALHGEVEREVRALVDAIARGCETAAGALRARRAFPIIAAVGDALAALDRRLAALCHASAARELPLEDVMRFYQFIQALKALGRDLSATAEKVAA